MQSDKILDIEKIYHLVFRYAEIDTAGVVLEYVPVVIFIQFQICRGAVIS